MDRSYFNLVLQGSAEHRRFYHRHQFPEIIAEALKHPDFVMFDRGDCLTRIILRARNGHKYSDIVKWCTDALTIYGLTSYTIRLAYIKGAGQSCRFIDDMKLAGFNVVDNGDRTVTISHRNEP